MATESKAFENILYEVSERVATITMNKPDRLNALGPPMREDIAEALRRADEDDEVRCIILTGSGRAFSSGADIGHGLPGETAWDWYRFHVRPYAGSHLSGRGLYKPLMAAVNGLAYGAGMITTTECDIVIASDQARFCMIEARMGSSGVTNLPYLVGPQWAKLLMLTGEVISAKLAQRIGLIALVVPHDRLMERARAVARRIAAMPRYGVMLNKANIDGTLDMMGWLNNQRLSTSHSAITDTMAVIAETPDGRRLQDIGRQEGFRAFLKARDAAFTENLFEEENG